MKYKNYIKQIQALLQKTGRSQREMAQEMGVSFAAFNRWLNRHAIPHPSKILKIEQLHRQWIGLPPLEKKEYRRLLQKASRYKIKSVFKDLQNNTTLLRELLVDCTYNSNTLEGTTLTFRETETLIVDHVYASKHPFIDNLVISNHAAIVKDILFKKYRLPLSEPLIQELHARLFQGIREDAGYYSKYQRGITGLNLRLPDPKDIPEEMAGLFSQAKKIRSGRSVLETIAQFHADFELIHPFGDGNGRVGRLIMLIQFLHYHYPPVIIEDVRKAQYYETLEEAQRRNLQHFVLFLIEEMERTFQLIQKYR